MDFKVTGRGEFPIDMLRYDECWPIGPGIEFIGVYNNSVVTIHLRTHWQISSKRWESFGWKVTP